MESFVNLRSQKDLRSMKKGVNWIENQGENWHKMLENGKIIHFSEFFYQLYIQLSLALNVIETTRFFLQKEGGQSEPDEAYTGTQSDEKYQKRGSSPQNFLIMPKYGSTLPL